MERLKNSCRFIHREYRKTIEWRSPLTGLYLMAVNSAFWVGVIYCDPRIQEAILATSSACIFAWDILLSSSNDRSIITHLFMWPFQSIFRTFSVGGSLYSIHLLRADEIRLACYAAYATLACLLVNPVWEYNEVNQKIGNTCERTANHIGQWVYYLIINPIITVYEYTKYIVLFRWVPPLFAYLKHFVFNFRESCRELATNCRNWIQRAIVERTKYCYKQIKEFLRYWFCAHWWPGLKKWTKINIGQPLLYAFDYVCGVLVYIFCCHWVPPIWRFFVRQMKKLGAVLHYYIVEPIKIYLLRQFERFRNWLRATLHRIAIAIRDSILWPVCLLVVETAKQISLVIYSTLLEPILMYLHGRYKIIETSALIYILGPVCETVIENIPEKNPFCDESDVEFEGFLPEVNADEDLDENYEEEDVVVSSAPSSPIPEEEFEFERGLQFSAINGSESSDDEFDLHHAPKKTEKVLRKRRPAANVAQADDEYEILQ
ncbi:unnamed protein product [Caenorhabditis angaria]|uniref:Uncharacterized protein n=1 Tax=Caenorhabditis angaria TaxID=860376 RepID=A0A9P1IMK3_9PELO|nr:unnamed protein product [Caenorhabditis angaria]